MLLDRFYPDLGGVEKHAYKLSEEFIKHGDTVTIISFYKDELSYSEYEEKNGIKIYRIKNSVRKSKKKIIYNLYKKIKLFFDADIIHCHDFSIFWEFCLLFKIIIFWKKIFVTFHGYEGDIPPQKKVIMKRRITQKITSGNISIGKYIEKWYGTKANIISYGACEKNEDKSFSEYKSSIYKFVYIGRLEKDTGIELYLEGFKLLTQTPIKYNLKIVGDGTLRENLEKYCKKNNINVIFEGFVNFPEKFIEESDICLTSGYLGILEAMIYKKIVISVYDNELKKDYLKLIPNQEKMFIAVNNSVELKERILNLLKNEVEREEYINNSFNWAKKMTWGKMREDYLKLWKKI